MISKQKLKILIDETERKYNKCWETLLLMKRSSSSSRRGQAILDFQPLLCSALFELEGMRHAIEKERTSIIKKKETISKDWFLKRIRCLAEYQKVIKECISIGKSLGDAFAWPFYKKHHDLISEHLKHNEIFHLPPGIGGIGELKFVQNIKHFGRQLVLYHGTTTFLRLGDVSFVNLKNLTISGIGELKTKKSGKNKLKRSLRLIGPDSLKSFHLSHLPQKKDSDENDFSNNIKTRLRKQTREILNAFQKKPVPELGDEQVESEIHTKALESLLKDSKSGCFSYRKADDGLLLLAYKQRRKTLFNKLLNPIKGNFKEKLNDLGDYAIQILIKESPNRTVIEPFHYSNSSKPYLMPGMTPLFWWPIDSVIARQIIFQDSHVFTIFNCSHVINKLESLGLQVIIDDKTRRIRLWKKVGDNKLEFINIEYFFLLVQYYLLSEDSVFRMIIKGLSTIENLNLPTGSKINFEILQEFR